MMRMRWRTSHAAGLPWLLVLTTLTCAAGPASAETRQPVGVIVSLSKVDQGALLEQAREVGGARWTMQQVSPAAADPPAIRGSIAAAREQYLEADFLGCLATCRKGAAGLDEALGQGHRAEAGQLALLFAACAHGAGDQDLARTWLRRLFVQDLGHDATLLRTRPDFDGLLEEVRAKSMEGKRIRVSVASRPPADLLVDGRAMECRRTPCTIRLLPGQHLFVLRRLGVGHRTVHRAIEANAEIQVSLDRLSPDQARHQLERAATGPKSEDLARAAATAFGGQIVALVWHGDRGGQALVFDRRRDRVLSRVEVRGRDDAVMVALRSALQEWRGDEEPPFYTSPWFYVPVAAALATATGLIIYFAARPDDPGAELVFP